MFVWLNNNNVKAKNNTGHTLYHPGQQMVACYHEQTKNMFLASVSVFENHSRLTKLCLQSKS